MTRSTLRTGLARPLLCALAGCGTIADRPGFPLDRYPPAGSFAPPAPSAPPAPAAAMPPKASRAPSCEPRPGDRLDLGLAAAQLHLPAGRWAIRVELPKDMLVTVGVAGPAAALRSFEVIGQGSLRALHSERGDGELPAFISFATDDDAGALTAVVDADRPVWLVRAASAPFDPERKTALPLVGMPAPLRKSAGYEIETPGRYAFVRADVAEALRIAFRQTRRRLHRNVIAVEDASQWNGDRPATDRGLPRHISHAGGRDVDIALPSRDGPSRRVPRCQVVLVQPDRAGCAPGSARGLDAERLAYLLGQLFDGPEPRGRTTAHGRPAPIAPVELIYADPVYIDAIRAELPALRKKKWISDDAFGALGEEGILRASPWHVDHVHVRFSGPAADVSGALRLPAEP